MKRYKVTFEIASDSFVDAVADAAAMLPQGTACTIADAEVRPLATESIAIAAMMHQERGRLVCDRERPVELLMSLDIQARHGVVEIIDLKMNVTRLHVRPWQLRQLHRGIAGWPKETLDRLATEEIVEAGKA
jgi:hypothetical protein